MKEIKGSEYTNNPDKLVRQTLDELKALASTLRRAAGWDPGMQPEHFPPVPPDMEVAFTIEQVDGWPTCSPAPSD